MLLPYLQTQDPVLQRLQTVWRSLLNPVITNPVTSGILLSNIPLVSGTNVINTTLGRKQQGWIITDITAASNIYRSAAFNELTLTLNSSAACTVSLMVY